jgi:hypothetical protein
MTCHRSLITALERLQCHSALTKGNDVRYRFEKSQVEIAHAHSMHFINQYLRVYDAQAGPLHTIFTTSLQPYHTE